MKKTKILIIPGMEYFMQSGQVTNRLRVVENFGKAIYDSGALPIIFSTTNNENYIKEILDEVDGVIFTGGEDVANYHFNTDTRLHVGPTDYYRDEYELTLLKILKNYDMPVLGVCRGCQLLALFTGNSIYQDINTESPTTIKHDSFHIHAKTPLHKIQINKDSFLYEIYKKDEIWVNSRHHQAVNITQDNIKISAIASDGIIEAYELTDKPIYGIQWHPEGHIFKDCPVYDEQQKIFDFFVDKCKNNK